MAEREKRHYYTFADNGGALAVPVRMASGVYDVEPQIAAKAIRFIRTHAPDDAELLIEILGLTEHDEP